jgi:intein-encoded DNA endonuclease-like protein
MPAIKTLNQDFFKKWTPEMAYVLGFFAADGSMIKNSRGGYYIEFNITDWIVLEHIQNVTGSIHKITTRAPDARNKAHWKQLHRLQIGSKQWFEDLTTLGFSQHKSTTLTFPEVPKRYFADFTRGYFDGDGCVYFKEHWSKERSRMIWVFTTHFTSGSRKFLEVLHEKLKKCGVMGGRIATKERGYELIFSRNDSLALYRLMYHTNPDLNLFLPRKRDTLKKAIQVLKLESRV